MGITPRPRLPGELHGKGELALNLRTTRPSQLAMVSNLANLTEQVALATSFAVSRESSLLDHTSTLQKVYCLLPHLDVRQPGRTGSDREPDGGKSQVPSLGSQTTTTPRPRYGCVQVETLGRWSPAHWLETMNFRDMGMGQR